MWIDTLERYVIGKQYDGRANFFDDAAPLLDRAPCVIVPVVKCARDSFVDMVLGEGRGPRITSSPGEASTIFDDRFSLTEKQGGDLDSAINVIAAQAKLNGVFKRLLRNGQVAKSAVAILGVRNGKLFVDTTKSKWSTPTFNATHPSVVDQLEIRYPYVETYKDAQNQPQERVMLYRRVIDALADTTFVPAKASENGAEPDEWLADPAKTVVHGFGFCPVVWYPFLKEECEVTDFDGEAIHEFLLDEIDALNRSRSMRHRAAIMCGDPQMAEYGVGEDECPAPVGPQAVSAYVKNGRGPDGNPARDATGNKSWMVGSVTAVGRKRGAGVINTYRSKDAKAEWLSIPAGALKPLEEDGDDLEAIIAEALSWVPTDAKETKLGSNISGRALEWLHKKQTDKSSTIRDDMSEGCILPVVDMLLRIVLVTPAAGLRLPGAAKLQAMLKRYLVEVEVSTVDGEQPITKTEWVSPELRLVWPPFFAPTEIDAKATGDNVRADLNAKLILKRTAVEKIAPFYDIGDIDAYVLALEAEEKANPAPAAVLPPAPAPPKDLPPADGDEETEETEAA